MKNANRRGKFWIRNRAFPVEGQIVRYRAPDGIEGEAGVQWFWPWWSSARRLEKAKRRAVEDANRNRAYLEDLKRAGIHRHVDRNPLQPRPGPHG